MRVCVYIYTPYLHHIHGTVPIYYDCIRAVHIHTYVCMYTYIHTYIHTYTLIPHHPTLYLHRSHQTAPMDHGWPRHTCAKPVLDARACQRVTETSIAASRVEHTCMYVYMYVSMYACIPV
jgi:hypothetical protein